MFQVRGFVFVDKNTNLLCGKIQFKYGQNRVNFEAAATTTSTTTD